jgi:predicted phage-related endonuclease
LIVEIKCPYKGQASTLWNDVVAGHVPDHYAAQVQHQLMVSGAQLAHLYVFDGTEGLLRPIEPIDHAFQRIRDGWDQFQVYLDTDLPPPLTDADVVQREDADWAAAASAFAQAKQAADLADDVVTQAREALLALARHPKEQGAGVSVTRFWKAGAVNYKAVPELKGVNLERYRGKLREEVRVTTVG